MISLEDMEDMCSLTRAEIAQVADMNTSPKKPPWPRSNG